MKQRQIFTAIQVDYVGTPTITVSLDGVEGNVFNAVALPTHTKRKSRRVTLPEKTIGHVIQASFAGADLVRHQFESTADEAFRTKQLFQAFDVTFEGVINLQLFVDGVQKNILNGEDAPTATPLSSSEQKTVGLFFPAQTFGYIPHLFNATSDTGNVIAATPKALPVEAYTRLRQSTRVWVTYNGAVTFQFFVDGTGLFTGGKTLTDTQGKPKTENFRLPGGKGNIWQWAQIGGSGEIFAVETDESMKNQVERPTMKK